MELIDKDLLSIQTVRNLIREAKEAQQELLQFSQEKLDAIVAAIAKAGWDHAERLGKMANEETGFGRAEHKTIKNQFAAKAVHEAIRDMKTVGIISEDKKNKVIDIAVPMGVIAALIPSTNPTSTAIYKAMIAIKAGNSIVFSPHPSARRCILETARVIREAAVQAGCPAGAIGCMELLTMESTQELLRHPDIALILATGGNAMVKSAYSSGNPAIGVGPGNGPAFIERTADIPMAVKRILDSKTFDNGTICASEQSIVTEESIKEKVVSELIRQGAHFLNEEAKQKVASVLMRSNGTMNPQVVGRTPKVIAALAGIEIPEGTRVLIAHETKVGSKYPFSKEKLCPVLAFYTEKDWKTACDRCVELLHLEGAGHTLIVHSNSEEVIKEFALNKPVSRVLVNTPGALGGIGATTGLFPALTLGCGAVGGSSSSDNIGPANLLNIRRVGYGLRDLEDLQPNTSSSQASPSGNQEELVQAILKAVMEKLNA